MKKIEIDLPEIDGFEYTGEYRRPKKGECVLRDDGSSVCVNDGWGSNRHILKKKAPVYKVFKIGKNTDGGEYLNIDKSIEGCGGALVSIKALEDAMKLVNKAIINFDFEDEYAALMDLIK